MWEKGGKMKHKWFILGQFIFLLLILIAIFIFYPRMDIDLEGNKVSFKSINANVIILSNNPDFSNPRYVDIEDNVTFNLKPGTYYWKASNGIIESFAEEFRIDSELGLEILEKNDSYELKNVGDVRINVSKTSEGRFVGRIILEPEQAEEIENQGVYTGRQNE